MHQPVLANKTYPYNVEFVVSKMAYWRRIDCQPAPLAAPPPTTLVSYHTNLVLWHQESNATPAAPTENCGQESTHIRKRTHRPGKCRVFLLLVKLAAHSNPGDDWHVPEGGHLCHRVTSYKQAPLQYSDCRHESINLSQSLTCRTLS